jgi:hypothetical protein
LPRNNLAWLYVSVPAFWSGPKADAVHLALRAVSIDPDDGEFLDTAACAYAEGSDFAKTVAFENETIVKFVVTNPAQAGDRRKFEERLEGFTQGKTYLQTLAKPASGPATRPATTRPARWFRRSSLPWAGGHLGSACNRASRSLEAWYTFDK